MQQTNASLYNMAYKLSFKTVVLSDIHLGTRDAKAKEVMIFLDKVECDQLILNGDIIDGWALRRGKKWSRWHTKCVYKILEKSQHTKTYWIRGNHDDFLKEFLNMQFGNLLLRESITYTGVNGKKYLITHGDVFDAFITHQGLRFITRIGAVGYGIALWINRWYNRYRALRGLEYFSLSQKIKLAVKAAASFIGKFEESLVDYAQTMKCAGVICGHIHKAEMKTIRGIEYLNSGDWVESLTALVETSSGEWRIMTYQQFLEEIADL